MCENIDMSDDCKSKYQVHFVAKVKRVTRLKLVIGNDWKSKKKVKITPPVQNEKAILKKVQVEEQARSNDTYPG